MNLAIKNEHDTRSGNAEKLRMLRKQMGLTREQLAVKLRRSYRQITRWETGESLVPHWVWAALMHKRR